MIKYGCKCGRNLEVLLGGLIHKNTDEMFIPLTPSLFDSLNVFQKLISDAFGCFFSLHKSVPSKTSSDSF